MKNKHKVLASIIISIFIILFSTVTFAQSKPVPFCSNSIPYSNSNSIWPLIQCGNAGQHCCDFKEAMILVNRIISWIIRMSATIAAITFTIAGAKILLNPENPGKREEALEMFKKTVVGLALVLGAWLIINTIVSTLVSDKINALRFLNQINQ